MDYHSICPACGKNTVYFFSMLLGPHHVVYRNHGALRQRSAGAGQQVLVGLARASPRRKNTVAKAVFPSSPLRSGLPRWPRAVSKYSLPNMHERVEIMPVAPAAPRRPQLKPLFSHVAAVFKHTGIIQIDALTHFIYKYYLALTPCGLADLTGDVESVNGGSFASRVELL
jgi:hypothetical protein